jgi:hypothetical protein
MPQVGCRRAVMAPTGNLETATPPASPRRTGAFANFRSRRTPADPGDAPLPIHSTVAAKPMSAPLIRLETGVKFSIVSLRRPSYPVSSGVASHSFPRSIAFQ